MDNSYIPLIILVSFTIFSPRFTKATRPPAMFIFGDSTVDVGTNSFISDCQARADFPYYGIDLVNSRPTGRFSNGFNIADFLSKLLGFKRSPESFLFLTRSGNLESFHIQPFRPTWTALFLSSLRSNLQRKMFKGMNFAFSGSDLRRKLFRGVNFASGGSGLSDITGKSLKVVPMSEQINQFITIQSNLIATIGESSTEYMLSKSIFFISSGSNDILEYFNTNSTKPKEQFIGALMIEYESYIKVLYNLGARKFGIISVLPTGCCPSQRFLNATGGCLDDMNDLCLNFHSAFKTLLHKISLELEEFRYSLGNTHDLIMNIIRNPARYNFKYVDEACCGTGRLNAEQSCNLTTNLYKKRSEYLFWDRNHPTQAASHLVAMMLYGGELRFVSPVNFGELATNS